MMPASCPNQMTLTRPPAQDCRVCGQQIFPSKACLVDVVGSHKGLLGRNGFVLGVELRLSAVAALPV